MRQMNCILPTTRHGFNIHKVCPAFIFGMILLPDRELGQLAFVDGTEITVAQSSESHLQHRIDSNQPETLHASPNSPFRRTIEDSSSTARPLSHVETTSTPIPTDRFTALSPIQREKPHFERSPAIGHQPYFTDNNLERPPIPSTCEEGFNRSDQGSLSGRALFAVCRW